MEKNNFIVMHCWLKLNGKPKWLLSISHTVKSTDIGNEDKDGDPIDPTKRDLTKKVKRAIRGRKWEYRVGEGEARRGGNQGDGEVQGHCGKEGEGMCQAS